MNVALIKNLNIYQRVKLVAAVLAGLLIFLLLVGAVWVVTLPPSPVILPSSEALQATPVVLSTEDAETHYLDGFIPTVLDTDIVLSAADDNATGERLSLMASRPLFWAERRPIVIDEAAMEVIEESPHTAQASELDKVELAGVYFAGDASGVIVRANGQRMRVALGESLMGWKLESVNASEVHFSNSGQGKTLQLEHAGVSDYTPATSRRARSSGNKPASSPTQEP